MKLQSQKLVIPIAAVVLAVAVSASGLSPEDKCEAEKNKIAGKYAFCRQSAEAKAIKRGTAPDYSKCDEKLIKKWDRAEQRAINKGTSCIDSVSDTAIQSFVTAHSDAVAAALDGGALPDCGDGTINVAGEQCDGADLGGATCATIGFALGGSLTCTTGCIYDTAACLGGRFPASGVTTSFVVSDDGDLQAGASLAYVDNRDGTITDSNTGLMWEKKVALDSVFDPGNLHDADNCHPWRGSCSATGGSCGTDLDCPETETCNVRDCQTAAPDGLTIFEFVQALNEANFAGYSDWRVPNVRELHSIVDYGAPVGRRVSQAFHNMNCSADCTDLSDPTCSCTKGGSGVHWTSTPSGGFAWFVNFVVGNVSDTSSMNNFGAVRAVRGP